MVNLCKGFRGKLLETDSKEDRLQDTGTKKVFLVFLRCIATV